MKFLTAIVTVSLVIMITASAGYYFYNNSINESSYPSYHVDMYLNTTPYYPIHLNSNLTGNGTYQQLLTFSDPSTYGINSQGSNVLFYAPNGIELYAWLQSINGTSASYWIKNFDGSATIDMDVVPNQDYFSATGHLGEADTTTDNGRFVFPAYLSADGVGITNRIFNGQSYAMAQYNSTTSLSIGNVSSSSVVSTTLMVNLYDGGSIAGLYLNIPTTNTQVGSISLETNAFRNTTTAGWTSGFMGVIGQALGNGPSNYNYYTLMTDSYSNLTWWGADTYTNSSSNLYSNVTLDDYNKQPSYIQNMTGQSFKGSVQVSGNFLYAYLFVRNAISDVYGMPTFTIGSGTNMTDHVDASYLSNSITIPIPNWFNLTLKAYTNYSFTFQYNNTPLYFTYDGLINNTIYTGFFDHNLTLDIHFIALGYSGKTQSIVLERG